jgi:hypothetical protein
VSAALGPGAFLAGALQLLITVGGAAAAATLLTRRRLPELDAAAHLLALAVLTIGGLLAAELVPLILGILTRATVPLTGLVEAAVTALLTRSGNPTPAATVPRFRVAPSWALLGVGLLVTATAWIAYLQVVATLHVASVDALSFHLPGVIRFIQTGSLWQTTQYLPGQAQGNYPQNGDLLFLAMTLPWHSLAFVRYVEVPLLAIAGLGVFATGRELGAPAPAAGLVALALIAIRPTLGPALDDVLTDPTFLAGFSAGVYFLVRHHRTRSGGELALAGLGLGIALGTKWYGLTDVPAVIVVWLVAEGLGRRQRSALARDTGLVVGFALLAGGVWLLRNLILTGDPVFDYRVTLFGQTLFAAPPAWIEHEIGFTLAHYLGDPSVLRHYVWPVFVSDFGVSGALIVAGAVLAAVMGRRDRRILWLGAAALLAAIAYVITPYSAQGLPGEPLQVAANTRYGVPALVLAAPLLAVAIGRLGRRAALPAAVAELILLGALIDDLHRYLPVSAGRLVVSGVVLLVIAAVAGGVRAERPGDRRAARPAALAAERQLGRAGLVYHYARVLARTPYYPPDPTVGSVLAADARAPGGLRIDLTGTWTAQGLVPVAPLFGPRLQNHVVYVGPFTGHRLAQYKRASPFVAALRRTHPQLLEIGTGFPPSPDPIQLGWARAAGYTTVVSRSPRLILLAR